MAFGFRGVNRPFNWAAWDRAQQEFKRRGAYQQERSHLWALHDQKNVDILAGWLAETASTVLPRPPLIRVSSTWVDCHPVASFTLSRPIPLCYSMNCELGDLLLVVEDKRSRVKPPIGRALLLQAKCVDHPEELDASAKKFPGKTSTHKQRNLYESHLGPFEVKTATNGNALPNSPYDLARANLRPYPMLGRYARYLLIPRERTQFINSHHYLYPYLTMWPQSRGDCRGTRLHLAELLLSMADLHFTVPTQGERVDISSEWSRLVHDILSFGNGRSVNRFKTSKPAVISAQHRAATFRQSLLEGLSALAPQRLRTWTRSLQLYMVPPTDGQFPPVSDGPAEEPEVPPGMLVIRVVIEEDGG